MANNSPEKGLSAPHGALERPSAVVQPGKAEKMQALLVEVNDIISESSPAKAGEQWSGGQQGTGGAQPAKQGMSWRDQAIASIPTPQIMQKQLEVHIEQEVKVLRKQAARITDLRKPGAAHHFNELQSKIRRLNSLLAGLLEASFDVLKRIFIRVFIDKQPIL